MDIYNLDPFFWVDWYDNLQLTSAPVVLDVRKQPANVQRDKYDEKQYKVHEVPAKIPFVDGKGEKRIGHGWTKSAHKADCHLIMFMWIKKPKQPSLFTDLTQPIGRTDWGTIRRCGGDNDEDST